MRLKNKKTGQLGNFIINKDHFECVDLDYVPEYNSIAELNEEWEDYEEPKPRILYYIDRDGKIVSYKNCNYPKRVFDREKNEAIGNCFESKKDAEEAMKKLEAWKRLKDKGFRFHGYCDIDPGEITFSLDVDSFMFDRDKFKQLAHDLDLLFGGEE